MTVRAGREFLAIPGPTTMPDEVLRAMHRPALDIYSDQMVELTDSLLRDLSKLFATKGHSYIYIANGHGAWEGDAQQRAVARRQGAGAGERPLRDRLGQCRRRDGRRGRGAEGRLAPRDPARRSRGAAASRTRTTASRRSSRCRSIPPRAPINDIEAIGKAIKATGHPALFMVDTVASLGCMPFEMDAWGIDVAMSGSQKGLMTPPGLGFVAANDRAREVHKKANLRTPYWDWTERDGPEHYRKYAGTAPVHLLFALRQAIDMLFEEGLENALLRHRLLAEAVRRAVAVWAEGQVLGFNIAEACERSNTVTTVVMKNGHDPDDAAALLQGKMRRGARHRHRRVAAARRSGSPIWATSTRR